MSVLLVLWLPDKEGENDMAFGKKSAFTLVEVLCVVAVVGTLIGLLLPAVQAARENARRAECANNLSQIGMALAHYDSARGALPPGTIDEQGPIYSVPQGHHMGWMAQILPFIEYRSLHIMIDFSQSVYAKKNAPARKEPIGLFSCPSYCAPITGVGGNQSASLSCYAGCHADRETPIDEDNNGVLYLNSHVRDEDVIDGMSHTIFVGEKLGGQWDLGWMSGTRATLRNTGTAIGKTAWDSTNPYGSDGTPVPAWAQTLAGPGGVAGGLPGYGPPPYNPRLMPTPVPVMPEETEEQKEPETTDGQQVKPAVLPTTAEDLNVGGFGSMHGTSTNFVFGDGAVRAIENNIDLDLFARLGSRNDGKLLEGGPTRERKR